MTGRHVLGRRRVLAAPSAAVHAVPILAYHRVVERLSPAAFEAALHQRLKQPEAELERQLARRLEAALGREVAR